MRCCPRTSACAAIRRRRSRGATPTGTRASCATSSRARRARRATRSSRTPPPPSSARAPRRTSRRASASRRRRSTAAPPRRSSRSSSRRPPCRHDLPRGHPRAQAGRGRDRAPRLLLFTELEQVLGLLDAAAAVLARRIAAPLDRALLGQAALPLEEELHALSAALLALRGAVPGH